MNAFGLIEHWIASNYANPHQCLKKNVRKENPRLSLKNLTGAFVVLLVGWGTSFFIFLAERLNKRRSRFANQDSCISNINVE